MGLVLFALAITCCAYVTILIIGLIARRWRPYSTQGQRKHARVLCLLCALLGAVSLAVVEPILGPKHALSLVGVLQVPAGFITATVFYLWVSAFPLKLLINRDNIG